MNIKTIAITLPETPERTEKAKTHFSEMGVNAEFYWGINAEVAGLKNEHPYMVDRKEGDELFFMGHKPTGIMLSHVSLWSACMLMPYEHFFILEVDAQFPEGWKERYYQALRDVPEDFDFLFIGCCDASNKPMVNVLNDIYVNKYPQCMHAYIVAKKALPTMIQTQRKVYGPIDCTLHWHTFPLLKVYTVLPRIVSQFDTEFPD